MDFQYMLKYLPMYFEAAKLTVGIGLADIVLSIVIGLVCSNIMYFKIPVLKHIVTTYIEISRNTPLLVQLFFIYYGLPKIGIKTDPYIYAVF